MDTDDSETAPVDVATSATPVDRDTTTGQFAEGNEVGVRFTEGNEAGIQFGKGNQIGRTHGVRAFREHGDSALPPDLREQITAFREALEADQGGASELTTIGSGYVRRLAQLEAICELLTADLLARGIFTKTWRVRSTYNALLLAVDRWDKLAQRLGIDRKSKPVNPLDRVRQAVEEANRK